MIFYNIVWEERGERRKTDTALAGVRAQLTEAGTTVESCDCTVQSVYSQCTVSVTTTNTIQSHREIINNSEYINYQSI